MGFWQGRSRRTKSSKKLKKFRKKRLHEMGGSPAEPTLGSRKYRTVRGHGGNTRFRILKEEYINVNDTKGKTVKTKILEVIHNPSNVDYDRRGVLTKGAIVKTELGEVRVSSRPSRGTISGILIEKPSS